MGRGNEMATREAWRQCLFCQMASRALSLCILFPPYRSVMITDLRLLLRFLAAKSVDLNAHAPQPPQTTTTTMPETGSAAREEEERSKD